ncbi:hypothetical protein [Streptomyces acidiscabies]|uniref:hypothetical protein n=1 Tax=Streptomyces acidiscabies TaxID=42234 RepID=UPI0038F64760
MNEIKSAALCVFAVMVFLTIWIGALSMMYAISRHPCELCPGCVEDDYDDS